MKLTQLTSAAVLALSLVPSESVAQSEKPTPVQADTHNALFSVLHDNGTKTPIIISEKGGLQSTQLQPEDRICIERKVKIVKPLNLENRYVAETDCEGGTLTTEPGSSLTVFPEAATKESLVYVVAFEEKSALLFKDTSRTVGSLGDKAEFLKISENPVAQENQTDAPVPLIAMTATASPRSLYLGLRGGETVSNMTPFADVQVQGKCLGVLHSFEPKVNLCLDARADIGFERKPVNTELEGVTATHDAVTMYSGSALGQIGLHGKFSRFNMNMGLGAGYQASVLPETEKLYTNDVDGSPVNIGTSWANGPKANFSIDGAVRFVNNISCGLEGTLSLQYTNEKIPEQNSGVAPSIKFGLGCGVELGL